MGRGSWRKGGKERVREGASCRETERFKERERERGKEGDREGGMRLSDGGRVSGISRVARESG